MPKLNENEVLVPSLLALVFDIHLLRGHANNVLVKNVSRALVDKMVVNYKGSVLQETVGTTFTKSGKTFSFPRGSGTTYTGKGSSQRPSAKSARGLATGTPQTPRKPSWVGFMSKSTGCAWITRS